MCIYIERERDVYVHMYMSIPSTPLGPREEMRQDLALILAVAETSPMALQFAAAPALILYYVSIMVCM